MKYETEFEGVLFMLGLICFERQIKLQNINSKLKTRPLGGALLGQNSGSKDGKFVA